LSSTEAELRVRPAVAADADLLLDWANDPDARAASLTPDRIDRAGHIRWLERILADDRAGLWIGIANDQPIGQVRVVVDPAGDGEVSVSVAAEARGRGRSAALLREALAAAAGTLPVASFVAHVRPSNEASRRLFLRTGFAGVGTVVRNGVEVLEFRLGAGSVGRPRTTS
jgi:RimJ/RimL family protein N-acetyltransferase